MFLRQVGYLLISGHDDGSFKVWDLRSLKEGNSNEYSAVGHFKWHRDQITSIEWDPNDESVLAVSGADNQVTVWDLSLEKDDHIDTEIDEEDFPAQLLFVHQGLTDPKEVHWHPQLPGILATTAEDGFHVFKPSVTEEDTRNETTN